MKHVEVVGALIVDGDKFFICQRSSVMSLPLLWEFPGGKVEFGESNEVALVREINEELSCDINVVRHINTSFYEYDNFTINLSVYECTLIGNKKPIIEEHSASAWISLDQFDDYNFTPAGGPAIKQIKGLYGK